MARNSEMPTQAQLQWPVLRAFKDLPTPASNKQLVDKVVPALTLSDEVLKQWNRRHNKREIEYRIDWVKQKLRAAGLIENSGWGQWSITDIGRRIENYEALKEEIHQAIKVRGHKKMSAQEGSVDTDGEEWFEDYAEKGDEIQIDEYDITAAPNDFNILTIYNFMETGSVRIPGFQRNFVWDIGRASKLIESLILGLPVPQIFLYEAGRNEFVVIDGQQRLMSVYYFMKQRFPKKEKRAELRTIFDRHGKIPDEIIHDDNYFENFRLKLPEAMPAHPNKFKGLAYGTLGSYKMQFELRTIRNVIIKQNSPKDDDSSMYEIFNRLNTGGINLRPQEIRTSMYHSPFYEMLYRANSDAHWRRILGNQEPDLHMKDVEILLRGFAMLIDGDNYAPSMVKFLNQFSRKCRAHSQEQNEYLERLLNSFFVACCDLPGDAFLNKNNRRFNVALYETVFAAACNKAFHDKACLEGGLKEESLSRLEQDKNFQGALLEGTTQTKNVKLRLSRAREIIPSL